MGCLSRHNAEVTVTCGTAIRNISCTLEWLDREGGHPHSNKRSAWLCWEELLQTAGVRGEAGLPATWSHPDLLKLATECQDRHIRNSARQVGPWHGLGSLWPFIAEAQFQSIPLYVGFVVNKVAMAQVFLWAVKFYSVCIFLQIFHPSIHLFMADAV
jgi:hypothetical protein